MSTSTATRTAHYGIPVASTAKAEVIRNSRQVVITDAGEFDGTYTLPAAPAAGWVITSIDSGFIRPNYQGTTPIKGLALTTDHGEHIHTDLRLLDVAA